MKYLTNAIKQLITRKRPEQTHCNYSNNYYGDQRCIESSFSKNQASLK